MQCWGNVEGKPWLPVPSHSQSSPGICFHIPPMHIYSPLSSGRPGLATWPCQAYHLKSKHTRHTSPLNYCKHFLFLSVKALRTRYLGVWAQPLSCKVPLIYFSIASPTSAMEVRPTGVTSSSSPRRDSDLDHATLEVVVMCLKSALQVWQSSRLSPFST